MMNTSTPNNSSASSAPKAGQPTPHDAGQAALRHHLTIDPDIRNRSRTGAVLWGVTAVLGAVQQYGPDGVAMRSSLYIAFLVFTCVMAGLCLYVGPRLSGRTFEVAEELVIVSGWAATAGLVAATGGAGSPDIGLFANAMFYCAYFMRPDRIVRQIAIGTLAMWAPLVYDWQFVVDEGFVADALVMTAVLWAMVVLIARNRHMTQQAELRARRLALTDPLTGLANLRTFERELQGALENGQATSSSSQLGVAFVDVNGLKAANTVFGHAGGDELIRRTADALLDCSPHDGLVARVGGDEFSVLVPGAGADEMRAFAEDFALAIARAGDRREGPAFDLSASIGTAVFPDDGASTDELMHVADERMYDSKAALPPRLPTPETSGGRSLSDAPLEEVSRFEAFVTGAAPAAAMAWLLGGGMILAGAAFNEAPGVHVRLALILAGICVAVAGVLGLVSDERRPGVERASSLLAVAIAFPVVWATGGATTPILPLAYLVVAHAAYALGTREALLRIAAIVGIVFASLAINASTAAFASTAVILAEILVIAGLLFYNRQRADAAEQAALKLSRVDALTGLANRRVFECALAEAAERFNSGVAPQGGLILADVDDFKLINTSGGHKSGDEVLRMIASVLEGAIGRDATVCRIGGDEFALILDEGDAADLMRGAAKCNAAINAVDWNVLCEPKVTISVGYAAWEHVDTWKDLVVAADLALRTSKESGKNTVSQAPQTPAISRIGLEQAAG